MAPEQLARILASPTFAKSQRSSELLRFLVNAALANPEAEISERAVAAGVFGRGEHFDPTQDAIVRVQISRLRANLEQFYKDNRNEPVLLSIPKGSYTPVFWLGAKVSEPESEGPAAVAPGPPPTPVPAPHPLWRWAVLCAVTGAALAGTWIAFERPTHPQTQAVTSMPGLSIQPSVSPDGGRVAFAWDAEGNGQLDIFVKPITGDQAVRLTSQSQPSRNPVWSPDGQSIAFLRVLPDVQQAVMVIPAAGGAEREVTRIATTVAGLAWTPDSRYLIVSDSPPEHGPLALFLVSAATGQRRRLTPYGNYFHPTVSHDGRQLVFANDTAPGRTGVLFAMPMAADYQPAGAMEALASTGGRNVFWPSFSFDDRSLLYVATLDGLGVLYRYTFADRRSQRVEAAGQRVRSGTELASGRILISRRRERTFLARIMEAGGEPVRLFPSAHSDYEPAPSPDSRWIAFRSRRDGTQAVWISEHNGGNGRRIVLPHDTINGRMSWSPDSQTLYLQGVTLDKQNRVARIYRANVRAPGASIPATPVDLDGAQNANPSVSRDGRWLYFASDIGGSFQLWRSPIGGGKPERMVSEYGEGELSTYGEESPDGTFLYYTHGRGIWRMSLRDRTLTEMVGGPPARFRITPRGLYYETITSASAPIHLLPSKPGGPDVIFFPRTHQGWAPEADGSLLVALAHEEIGLELLSLP